MYTLVLLLLLLLLILQARGSMAGTAMQLPAVIYI
jgi:hypothetical protein